MENSDNMQDKLKKQKNTIVVLVILLILLLIAVGVLSKLYFSEKKTTEVKTEIIKTDVAQKDSLKVELNNLLVQYDNMKTNNDSMNKQLQVQKTRIRKLISDINNNKAEIKAYKKELGTLRDIMKSYVVQIDSLNTRNKILHEENVKVKGDFEKSVNENKQLAEKNTDLNSKVEMASVLEAKNIVSQAYKSRGRTTSRSGSVEKIGVCFTLEKNVIAKAGKRNLFLRIARPDELVLANSSNDLFSFEGKDIAYSAMREVDYDGKSQQVCIYYDNKQELVKGTYYVDIFTDGVKIGTSTFVLK
ncbi:MAG: hypothetical protein NTW49_10250 [Bacteroidia bacterium]|nr:hypothetical protein [Bacteroidia bacterium]